MAQVSTLDDQTHAIVVAMVQEVGHTVAPMVISTNSGGTGALLGAPNPQQEGTSSEPDQTPGAPNPQVEEPQREPNKGTANLPELNLTDLAQYKNQGVTIKAPADWTVNTDTEDGTPFEIQVPETSLIISLTSDSDLSFPSWLGLAIFRSQPQVLIKEFSPDAQVEDSSTLYTDQGLPLVKLAFSGTQDNQPVGGALYTLAPNKSAYILTVVGPSDQWLYAAPGLDLIAKSITFDSGLITAVKIGDKPEDYTDDDKTMQVTVPAGWYVMSTGDDQFPVIMAEPGVSYVAAVGTDKALGKNFDPTILKQFTGPNGELDPSKYADLIHAIADSIGNSGGPFKLDEEQSHVIPRDGALLLKLVGDADIGNDMSMPVIIYVDMRDGGVAAGAIFGDIESAKGVDADMQAMIASIKKLGD